MHSQGMKSRTENRREQKERKRKRVPNPATLDHSVASYDAQGSYGTFFNYVNIEVHFLFKIVFENFLYVFYFLKHVGSDLFIYYKFPLPPLQGWHTSCHEISDIEEQQG